MKIDKVIFTSSYSPDYIDFWNLNSKLYKEELGITPELYLFGDPSSVSAARIPESSSIAISDNRSGEVSEKYGKVFYIDFLPNLPEIVQIVTWKFYHTQSEPDTTWIIGDIDQIPLPNGARKHFIDQIKDVPEDYYLHLAHNSISEHIGESGDYWRSGTYPGDRYYLAVLAGHYHVAKGSTFKQFLDLDCSFEDWIKPMIKEWYVDHPQGRNMSEDAFSNMSDKELKSEIDNNPGIMWAYEESYTSNKLRGKLHFNRFKGFDRPMDKKICRSTGCAYDPSLLKEGHYVDIHCPRPFYGKASGPSNEKNSDLIISLVKEASQ